MKFLILILLALIVSACNQQPSNFDLQQYHFTANDQLADKAFSISEGYIDSTSKYTYFYSATEDTSFRNKASAYVDSSKKYLAIAKFINTNSPAPK